MLTRAVSITCWASFTDLLARITLVRLPLSVRSSPVSIMSTIFPLYRSARSIRASIRSTASIRSLAFASGSFAMSASTSMALSCGIHPTTFIARPSSASFTKLVSRSAASTSSNSFRLRARRSSAN